MFSIEHDHEAFLVCRLSGRLTRSDYEAMVPEFENALQLRHGPIRLMIVLERFKGWEIGALWEDLKFYVGHRRDFERISVVGHSRLEEWGTLLSRPFFGAKMRFFDVEDRDTAAAWLSEGKGEGRSGLEENTEKLK